MFPPLEEKVLENNPEFAKLYWMLTTTILNVDGSTKEDVEIKDHTMLKTNLDTHHHTATKHHILERTIATTTALDPKPTATAKHLRADIFHVKKSEQHGADSLSEPLLDLLLILPTFLEAANSLPPDSVKLLLSSPPLSNLDSLLPELADVISANLHATALSLTCLVNPSTNPSYLDRHVVSLPTYFLNLTTSLSEAETALISTRLRTLTSLATLLQTYSECLTCLIRSLEAKHGVVARSLELHASEVSLEAQHVEKQSEQMMWKGRKEIFTPDTAAALQNYVTHLRDVNLRTTDRVKGLLAELESNGIRSDGEAIYTREEDIRETVEMSKEIGKQMKDVK